MYLLKGRNQLMDDIIVLCILKDIEQQNHFPTAVRVLKQIINKAQPMQYGLTDTTLDRRTMLSVMRARLSCVIHRSNAIAMLADAAARGKDDVRSNRQERKIQGHSSYKIIPMPHERQSY